MQYDVLKSFQNDKNNKEIETNRRNNIKILSDISYKNLENHKGKRTTNISLNVSNSSQNSSSKDAKRYKNLKNYSAQVSALLSPNLKINIVDNSKKKLRDYQQDKRAKVPPSNLVIVMNDKNDNREGKADNLFTKYLKSNTTQAKDSKTNKSSKSIKKTKVVELQGSDYKQNTFTIDGETKVNTVCNTTTNDHSNGDKEQKLKALQNMPIKKFIVHNKDEVSYR